MFLCSYLGTVWLKSPSWETFGFKLNMGVYLNIVIFLLFTI